MGEIGANNCKIVDRMIDMMEEIRYQFNTNQHLLKAVITLLTYIKHTSIKVEFLSL